MALNSQRSAAPTARPAGRDASSSEELVDPHDLKWTRGAPPIDSNTYPSPSNLDVVAESVTRGSAGGDGKGRRATGFQLLGGGTVSIVTGCGATNDFAGASLPAGYALTCEFVKITSNDTVGVVITW